jgi:hypothetical protein
MSSARDLITLSLVSMLVVGPPARLPAQSPVTLKDLPVGSSGYTVPWALWVDPERRTWLHPDYPVYEEPQGHAAMWVAHTPEGYAAIPPEYYDWKRNEAHGAVPPPAMQFLPVTVRTVDSQ